MLINKWLVTTNELPSGSQREVGHCLELTHQLLENIVLYRTVRQKLFTTPLALLLSKSPPEFSTPHGIEKIIGFFFHPSYCMVNHEPLVFIAASPSIELNRVIESINKAAIKQGFSGVRFAVIDDKKNNTSTKALTVSDVGMNLHDEVANWMQQVKSGNDLSELHLLIPERDEQRLSFLADEEAKLRSNSDYQLVEAVYKKQQQLEQYRYQLSMKEISEKNTKLYLSIQKQERANGLEWYYYEYEILPLWYKRFGHVIKVLQGKRSFKSLFNDDVKKYKD